jgi:hypothetical protein
MASRSPDVYSPANPKVGVATLNEIEANGPDTGLEASSKCMQLSLGGKGYIQSR